MNAVKAYYDGTVFIPVGPAKARRNQPAIVTILDDEKNPETSFEVRRNADDF